ncbi:site-specific DNA-methyltransferase, partial [Streptomyces sp. NPDC059618]|uniref:site-specific DNA-methyltransferase n=1 Tax=Streptomyces sp. NPDC059618 TaxID=3346887 RepID=UPI0036AF18F9
MTVDKLKMHSPDLTERNIDAIAELFPTVVTEALDIDGNPVRTVDFNALQQELSDRVIEGPHERYQLDWPGKRAAAFAANAPIAKTLRPVREDSVNFDTTKNLFIEGDNLDALKLLQESYLGKVKLIYIDPPYNTGAKDWKYNNDYVASDDDYRHSKWLSFMERRLKVARELLNPEDSVLIVTIDEKEYLRLGLLLEQTFPDARIQMVSSVINPKGSHRADAFARSDEYIYFVMLGGSSPAALPLSSEWKIVEDRRALGLRWAEMLRTGDGSERADRPNMFYPVFVADSEEGPKIVQVGEPLMGKDLTVPVGPPGSVAVWPIKASGVEGRWQVSRENFMDLLEEGFVRLGRWRGERTSISYLKSGERAKVQSGIFPVIGRNSDNSIRVDVSKYVPFFVPTTQWRLASHNAEQGGTNLVKSLLSGRKFPFPKSLYAVRDAIRFFVYDKPDAVILDFFSGSATTAHAVML